MIPRQIPLTFGISALAILVTACVTLQSSPDAAIVLITEFYDLKAELNSHIHETRRIFDAIDALGEQIDVLARHPLFYTLRQKAQQLAAQHAVDPSSADILAIEMGQTVSDGEVKLGKKILELSQQEKILSDQRTKLNDRGEQLSERFNTLRRHAIALAMTEGDAHVSVSDLTSVTLAFQEVRAVFDRLNTLVRTWNERVQRQVIP